MDALHNLSRTRPLIYGWTYYLGCWIVMGVLVLPLSTALYPLAGPVIASLLYYGASAFLGYRLLMVRREIADYYRDDEAADHYFGPLLRLLGWLLFWQFVMGFSLLMRGLRAARV
jgi:uncharacterized membrane protein